MLHQIRKKESIYVLIKTRRFALGLGVWLFTTWMTYYLFSMSKNVLYLQNAFGSTWRDLIVDKESFLYVSAYEEYFIAFLACLVGQYFLIEFLFFQPQKLLRYFRGRDLILVNNRMVLLNFIAAGGKFFMSLGLLYFGFTFYADTFLPTVYVLLVLLVLVLHLQAWMSIRRYFRNSFFPMILTFLFFANFSLFLSQGARIDTKPALEQIYNQRPEANLNLQLPEGLGQEDIYYSYPHEYSLQFRLYAGFKQLNGKQQLMIKNFNTEITIDSFANSLVIDKYKIKVPESKHDRMTCILAMDKNVSLKQLGQLHNTLRKKQIKRIFYATNPFKFDLEYPYQVGFLHQLKPYHPQMEELFNSKIPIPNVWRHINKHSLSFVHRPHQNWAAENKGNEIFIHLNDKSFIEIEGEVIDKQQLKKLLKDYIISTEGKAAFYIQFHPKATYQTYVNLIETLHYSYFEVRESEAKAQFGVEKIRFLNHKKQKVIFEKYPMTIFESFYAKERKLIEWLREEIKVID